MPPCSNRPPCIWLYDRKHFLFVPDTPKMLMCDYARKITKRSAANWRHGSCTPTVGLTEPPHCLRRIGYRSDCGWTGVSLSSLCVLAESGAARYFQSVFSACRLSAGHGVPLYTLMLISVTKRMYLVNGYSVVKEPSHFCHKGKQVKGFLNPFTCLLT